MRHPRPDEPHVRAISAEEFERRPARDQLVAQEHASRYAELVIPHVSRRYVLSWHSDRLEPVLMSNGRATWVGVDQRVACVDGDGRVVFAMAVVGNLLAVEAFPTCVAVLADATLILVNTDFSIRQVVVLPELPSGVLARNGRVVVVGSDGTELDVGGV